MSCEAAGGAVCAPARTGVDNSAAVKKARRVIGLAILVRIGLGPLASLRSATRRHSLRGRLIRPSDADYDAARALYNGMIDKTAAQVRAPPARNSVEAGLVRLGQPQLAAREIHGDAVLVQEAVPED